MKIQADTRDELDEAIDVHKSNGWMLMERTRTQDGTYTATLIRERTNENEDQQEIKFK